MFRHFIISAIACCIVLLATGPVLAAEDVREYTGAAPYQIDEYSREGTKLNLTFTNDTGADVAATVTCGSPADGGWKATAVSGICYRGDFCNNVATSAVATLKETVLAGKTITSESIVDGTEGKVTRICHMVEIPATLADVNTVPYSQCTGSAIKKLAGIDGSDVKKHCIFNYTGSADGIVGVDSDPDKNDDMFRIKSDAAAFLEYVDRSSNLDNKRLRWIERSGGGSELMLPSGPHSGPSSYKDYDTFMMRGPGGISTADACYPANVTICAGLAEPPPVEPPTPGVCGSAHGKSFASAGDIPAGDRCYLGEATAVATVDGGYTWTCRGIPSSEPADNCSATSGPPPIVYEEDRPDDEDRPPTEFCFFHVTGLLLSNTFLDQWYTVIGQVDQYSQLVGPGEYPQSEPFLNASQTTFDGIALGRDTSIIIYDGPNFTGNVLFEAHGPLVINNIHYREFEPKIEQNGGAMDTWLTETWPGAFNGQFPPSTRRWSEVGCNNPDDPKCMWNWGGTTDIWPTNGGRKTSLKVMCDEAEPPAPPPTGEPVNGSCGTTGGACASGTVSVDNGATSCGTTRTWDCLGANGGTTVGCTMANPACTSGTNSCADECGEQRSHGETWCTAGASSLSTKTSKCNDGSIEHPSTISGIGCDASPSPQCQ